MSTNGINTSITEKFLNENLLFVISETQVTFKNCNSVINLNQISNSRLIKKRDFTANIIVFVFSILFYVMILQPLYLNTTFELLILLLILISIVSRLKNYSYILLINKTNYDFNEIVVSKANLHFAKIFLSKFTISTLLKSKVKQEFEFEYQNLKEA